MTFFSDAFRPASLAAALLPRTRPTSTLRYPDLLSSVLTLVREEPVLRWATLTQGCNFAAFNAFWATLALTLLVPLLILVPQAQDFLALLVRWAPSSRRSRGVSPTDMGHGEW